MNEVIVEGAKNLAFCVLFGVIVALGLMLLVAVWRGDLDWWTFVFFRRATLVGTCFCMFALISAYVDGDEKK